MQSEGGDAINKEYLAVRKKEGEGDLGASGIEKVKKKKKKVGGATIHFGEADVVGKGPSRKA